MSDYFTSARPEGQIADLAHSWRELFGVGADFKPDVLWCVEVGLPKRFPNFALIPLIDCELPTEFAVARFDPPRIELRESLYQAARHQRARAREILAHELGHVVMQDHVYPKYLKDGVQERKRLLQMSVEHQADEFRLHFLLPQHIVSKMRSIGEIMERCGVTYRLAVTAGLLVGIRPRRRPQPYEMMHLEAEEGFDF
jgi:hypothetical protein